MKAFFKKDGTLIVQSESKEDDVKVDEFADKNEKMFYEYPIGIRKTRW